MWVGVARRVREILQQKERWRVLCGSVRCCNIRKVGAAHINQRCCNSKVEGGGRCTTVATERKVAGAVQSVRCCNIRVAAGTARRVSEILQQKERWRALCRSVRCCNRKKGGGCFPHQSEMLQH